MPDKSLQPGRDAHSRPGRLTGRLDDALQSRVNEVAERRFAEYDRRLADIDSRLKRQRRDLDKVSREAATGASLLQRLIPQLEALEVRFSQQQSGSGPVTGTTEEVAEARSVVEEVRREHDRVRARLSGVAWYEDRLRKLEEQVEAVTSRLSEERPHG